MRLELKPVAALSDDERAALKALTAAVYPPEVVAASPGRHLTWAPPDYSALVWDEEGVLVSCGPAGPRGNGGRRRRQDRWNRERENPPASRRPPSTTITGWPFRCSFAAIISCRSTTASAGSASRAGCSWSSPRAEGRVHDQPPDGAVGAARGPTGRDHRRQRPALVMKAGSTTHGRIETSTVDARNAPAGPAISA